MRGTSTHFPCASKDPLLASFFPADLRAATPRGRRDLQLAFLGPVACRAEAVGTGVISLNYCLAKRMGRLRSLSPVA